MGFRGTRLSLCADFHETPEHLMALYSDLFKEFHENWAINVAGADKVIYIRPMLLHPEGCAFSFAGTEDSVFALF